MEVISVCPLKVASLVAPRAAGVHVMTVVCKGTYLLAPGPLKLAPAQRELSEGDDPSGKTASVRVPTDVGPKKPRAEVLVVGNAFSPTPVRTLALRVAVGTVDKSLEVHADRALTEAGELVFGAPFTRMRLAYELAAGGPGVWNPLGMAATQRDAGLTRVPNLQPLGFVPSLRTSVPPVGFGPIGATWSPRVALANGRAAELSRARFSAAWSDAGVDPLFYQAAPADQRLDALNPGEMVILEGLSPNHPELVMRLPEAAPRAVREAAGHPDAAVQLRCDTLWIDTDAGVCTLTWRGEIELVGGRERIIVSSDDRAAMSASAPLPSLAGDEPIEQTVATRAPTPHVAAGPAWLAASPPSSSEERAPKYVPPPALLPRLQPAAASAGDKTDPRPRSADPALGFELDAARAGVLAASNAAALAVTREAGSNGAPKAAAAPAPADVIELLWLDAPVAARLRKDDALGAVVRELGPPAPRPEDESDEQADRRRDARRRREVLAVLRRGSPLDAAGLEALVARASEDGTFTPPLALVEGSLEMAFDPLAELRAMLAAVFPFAAGDKKLKDLVETVTATLAAPFVDGSGSVAATLSMRLREAFVPEGRGLPANYVGQHVERAVLQRREFQARQLFGRTLLRGSLGPSKLPVLLPSEAEGSLPLFRRFDVRALVEVRLRLEEHEAAPLALLMLAVGRVTRLASAPASDAKRS